MTPSSRPAARTDRQGRAAPPAASGRRHARLAVLAVLAMLAAGLPSLVQPTPAQAHGSCSTPASKSIRGVAVVFDQCLDRAFTHDGTDYRIHVYYTETTSTTNTDQCSDASPPLASSRCEHLLADNDDGNGDNVQAVAMAAEAEQAYRFYLDRGLAFVPAGTTELNVYLAEDPRGGGVPDSNSIQVDDDLIDNNDTIQKRVVTFHEIQHLVQIQNWGSVGWQGFYGEGISRAIEDRVDAAVDADTDHWFLPEINGVMTNDTVRTTDITTQSYPSAALWTWLFDNYRDPGDSEPVLGWDAIGDFYGQLASAATEFGALQSFVTGQGGSFTQDFISYTLALWAHRFAAAPPRLDFLDAEIHNVASSLSGHSVSATGPAFTTLPAVAMAPRTSRYWELSPASQCDYASYTFDSGGTPMAFSVMTADGGAWQDGRTATGTSFARTVRTATLDRIIGVATGLSTSGTVTTARGCVTPSISIDSPTSSAPAMVGTADAPRVFLTRVNVTGQDGSPVAGLTTDAFDVELRKSGTTTTIPATVVNGAEVLDDYWLLVQAPDAAAGAESGVFYDLTVSLDAGTTDTNNNAVLYVELTQDVVVVTDRSASMSDNDRIGAARNAGALLANQLADDDQGGYVAFNGDAVLREQLAQAGSGTNRADLIAAIEAETPAGATSIGDGLDAAATEHDARGDDDHACSFVLLSDGHENSVQFWADVQDDVKDNGCALHSIGFGPEANELLLQQIAATVPGGSYHYADDTSGTDLGTSSFSPSGTRQPSGVVTVGSTLSWQNALSRVYDYKSAMIAGRQRANTLVGDTSQGPRTCADTGGTVDFDDLTAGTQYVVGDSFTSRGIDVDASSFFQSTGAETTSGSAFVDDQQEAGGSGLDVATNNIRLDFALPESCQVKLLFADQGGSANLEVNGDLRHPENIRRLDGATVGGAQVSVDVTGDFTGVITIDGNISSFSIGGQEFWVDEVGYTAAQPRPHTFHVDDASDLLVLSMAWQDPDTDGRTTTLVDPSGDPVPTSRRRVAPTDTNEVWEVPDPEPGTWTLAVGGLPQQYVVTTQLRSRYQLHLFTGTPSDDAEAGVRVPLVASFIGPDGPVTGASVEAQVTAPDGEARTVPLHDDGDHGDGEAGDGVYGGSYDATTLGDTTADQPAEGEAPEVQGSYLVEAVATKGAIRREAQASFALMAGADRDGDGIVDRWELEHGLDPDDRSDGDDDPDRDGLSNLCESQVGTHPRNGDSDGGGESDGSELSTTTPPCTLGPRDPTDPGDDRTRPLEFVEVTPDLDDAGDPVVRVRWEPPDGTDLTFDVFRRCTDAAGAPVSGWQLVQADIVGPMYTDTDVSDGWRCRYQVVPETGTGVTGHGPVVGPVEVSDDPFPPGGSLLVAGGAARTDNLVVDLLLAADDSDSHHEVAAGATGAGTSRATSGAPVSDLEMRLSNRADFAGASWQPFQERVENWDLGELAPGSTAAVYLQLRDPSGNVGQPISDGIYIGGDTRLSGRTRVETGVAVSENQFGDGQAEVAVLARSDLFPDALAGTPLAVSRGGPILLTETDALHPAVSAELQRVLPAGHTVYLLGGSAALDASVQQAVEDLGYQAVRLSGVGRYETATAIAGQLGDVGSVFVTTGENFPDALAAGAAAARTGGAVVLTPSDQRHPVVDAYLDRLPDADLFAVGGPAARPYDEATPLSGRDRHETAVAVAERFFPSPITVGVARSQVFADALTGGVHIGRRSGPMLLTPLTDELHPAVSTYLCERSDTVTVHFVYGGSGAVSDTVGDAVAARVDGVGCPG